MLCPTHHKLIDSASEKYTVEDLKKMKKDHEKYLDEALENEMTNIGYAELEVALNAICSFESNTRNNSFEVIPPIEKIKKNNLTQTTHNLLIMGLSQAGLVSDYISEQARLDAKYPERLKAGFKEKYKILINGGIREDALFEGMLEFSSAGYKDFKYRAAGLAILSHLFEICEVFEK